MELDKSYVGTRWIINEFVYPESKGYIAIITGFTKRNNVCYLYDGNNIESVCSKDYFLYSFVIIDKVYELKRSIRKIKDSL